MPIPTHPHRWLIILIILSVVGGVEGCSSLGSKSVPQLPAIAPYPNAEQFSTQNITKEQYRPELLFTFETTDPSNAVAAFYKEALEKDGWEQQKITTGSFQYMRINGCQLSIVEGNVIPQGARGTHVEITLSTHYCE